MQNMKIKLVSSNSGDVSQVETSETANKTFNIFILMKSDYLSKYGIPAHSQFINCVFGEAAAYVRIGRLHVNLLQRQVKNSVEWLGMRINAIAVKKFCLTTLQSKLSTLPPHRVCYNTQ
jgi:hypothetical protein